MHLSTVNVHSTEYGTESIGNIGQILWNIVSVLIKNCRDLKALCTFKNKIKKLTPKDCLCRLCKVYVEVDFL